MKQALLGAFGGSFVILFGGLVRWKNKDLLFTFLCDLTQACLKASPDFPIAKMKVNTMGNKAFQ